MNSWWGCHVSCDKFSFTGNINLWARNDPNGTKRSHHKFHQKEAKVRKDALKGLTKDLMESEDLNDSQNAKLLREKIKALEEEFIVEECAKCKKFTILKDKRPSKTFLNI